MLAVCIHAPSLLRLNSVLSHGRATFCNKIFVVLGWCFSEVIEIEPRATQHKLGKPFISDPPPQHPTLLAQ